MIACIVPSRGRPGNVVELIEAWKQSTIGRADLLFVVDDDDPEVENYPRQRDLPRGIYIRRGPRRRLGGSLNWWSQVCAGFDVDYDAVGFMGDDHRPRSKAWDQRISDEISRRPLAVVYGNDLIHGANLPTAVFLDSRIIRTLGWMVYPGMIHLFFDNLWRKLGEELGTLTYLDDVIIEHCHPIAGKAEWDDGYAEVNSTETWDHDQLLYVEWVNEHMAGDVARLKAAI